MADTKISLLAELSAAPAAGDLFCLVDVSDTTMDAAGTDKKITAANALAAERARLDALETITEVSVTTGTTLTGAALGKFHVCSGSSNYTVVLPTAVGNTGKTIAFRITSTKLVTLDANGSQTIDGALTRIMWAGEVAVIESDGANWVKVGGKSRPMVCGLRLTANQTITASTQEDIEWDGTDIDNTGLMADIDTNNLINVVRGGIYLLTLGVDWVGSNGSERLLSYLAKNGSTQIAYTEARPANGDNPTNDITMATILVAGDTVTGQAYNVQSADQEILGSVSSIATLLSAVELDPW